MGDGSQEKDEHKGMSHCPSALGTAQEIRDFPPSRNIQTGIPRAFHTVPVAQPLTDWKNSISKGFWEQGMEISARKGLSRAGAAMRLNFLRAVTARLGSDRKCHF